MAVSAIGARYEYPAGSGNWLDVPPDEPGSQVGGSQINIPPNISFTLTANYQVLTTDGFLSPSDLLGKFIALDELRTASVFDPIAPYQTDANLSIMQSRRLEVTEVETLSGRVTVTTVPFSVQPTTRATPTETCFCALFRNPECGTKYVVPVEVVE